ncbi:hypothetical protein B0H12DRAFT_1162412 [Mycena haematopus]|nr:hypothetical protein B0H12DRAFT_1162412 [Mycena haematopus]
MRSAYPCCPLDHEAPPRTENAPTRASVACVLSVEQRVDGRARHDRLDEDEGRMRSTCVRVCAPGGVENAVEVGTGVVGRKKEVSTGENKGRDREKIIRRAVTPVVRAHATRSSVSISCHRSPRNPIARLPPPICPVSRRATPTHVSLLTAKGYGRGKEVRSRSRFPPIPLLKS